MQDLGISVIFEGSNFIRLLGGLWITLRIAIVAVSISIIFGIGLGILMTSKNKIVRLLTKFYLETVRIIPILVWLFVFFFTITKVFQIHLPAEASAILVFSLWGIAEIGDIVRGTVTSLPKHQWESGMALGLTARQIYRYIVLPQIIRRFVPAAMNLVTRMIKTTSLVVLIGVVEVLKVGQQIIEVSILKNPMAAFWVYAIIFALYFIICYPISLWSRHLEMKWQGQ